MQTSAQMIGSTELLAASSMIVLALGLSLLARLGVARRIIVAAARAVLQLLAVGYVLTWVFSLNTAWSVLTALLIMTSVAGWAALGRVERRIPGAYWLSLAAIALAAFVATSVVTQVSLRIEPWYKPQYLIPLAGMVLGNSLNGISLAMDRLLAELSQRRDWLEERLALGATPWEASRPLVVIAVRAAMLPILNTMTVAGIVSLPGLMTGQILAGADPLQAVAYQIVIMFMICGATAIGGMTLGLLVFRRLMGPPARLRFELISRVKN